jgi:hypothetical protein
MNPFRRMNAPVGRAPEAGGNAAYDAGQLVGFIIRDLILIGAAFALFRAGASLGSLSGRGTVKRGIWFAFGFAVFFLYQVIDGITVVGTVGGALKLIIVFLILLCGAAALLSVFAAINGLITMQDRGVNRAFIRND